MGWLDSATTSCMMEAIRMFGSAGRRFFGGTGNLFTPPSYRAKCRIRQRNFKVAHYQKLTASAKTYARENESEP